VALPAGSATAGGATTAGSATIGGATASAALAGTTVAVSAAAAGVARWQLFGSAASQVPPFLELTATADTAPQIDSQDPSANASMPSLTPELLASGHDADGASVQYVFTVFSSSGSQLATSGLISAGDWSVPSGKLSWNQVYYWTVQDFDGTYYSAAPQLSYFSTPVPQPLVTSSLAQNTGGQGFSPVAGNYTTAATDAQVATAGPALSIERDYNNLDPRVTGAFGAAWSSLLDMTVRPGSNDSSGSTQTMVVTYPDGQQVGFGKNTNGSFTAPEGRYATLAAVTGGYTLTDKNDTVYTFTQSLGSGSYGIASIADALGHALNFSYTSGRISQMASAVSGRALHVTWSTPAGATSPHVATVATDPVQAGNSATALTWAYSYNGDQLAKVCPPASSTACTAYSYQAGSDFQNAVLDSAPHSYWRLNEASGTTAASSVLANEGTDKATYSNVTLGQPGPLPGSAATSAGFNGTSSYIQLPTRLVSQASYQSAGLWFKTTATGGVLFGYTNTPITSATTPGQYTPSLYVGSSGDLHGEFWQGSPGAPIATSVPAKTAYSYDAYGNKATETDPAGNVTAYAYDPDGHLLTVTLQNYTGDPVNPSPPVNLVESSRAYDPVGRLASVTDSMGWVTSYTYTDDGLLATVTRSDPHGGASFTEQANTYDAAGRMISQVTGNGTTTTNYTLDAADRVTSEVLDPGAAPHLNRTTTNVYSPDDKVLTETVTNPNAGTTPAQVTDYTYDGMGNQTSQTVHADTSGSPPGPAGWWLLNETSGTSAADSSGNGHTGTASGGVTLTGGSTGAVFNGALDGQISASGPVLNTAASYSVSAWVNLSAADTSRQDAVSQDGVNASGFELLYNGSSGTWSFTRALSDVTNRNVSQVTSQAPAAAGTWTHLVGVYDATGSTISLYANGVLQGSTAAGSAPWSAGGATAIGRALYNAGQTKFFTGDIADVQLYPAALSAAQVATLYSDGRAGGALSARLTTSWTLDKRGLPTSTTDPNGNVTHYSYDEAGNLAVTTEPTVTTQVYLGSATPTVPVTMDGYNTFGEKVESSDANGNVTRTAYDAAGRPVSQTAPPYTPPGSSTQITAVSSTAYNGLGQVTSATDPLGNITSYTYDQLGDAATVTAPDTGVTHYTYDTNGDQLSATGPTGALTQATYDYRGRTLTATQVERYPSAAAYTTANVYADGAGGGGWLASQTTPQGVKTSYAYNPAGEATSVTDGARNTTRYAYDAAGRLTATTAPDGTSTTTTFDQAGRAVGLADLSATGAVLRSSSAVYDGVGNVTAATDYRGNTTTFGYDATGLVTSEVQPVTASSSVTTSLGYDAAVTGPCTPTGTGATGGTRITRGTWRSRGWSRRRRRSPRRGWGRSRRRMTRTPVR